MSGPLGYRHNQTPVGDIRVEVTRLANWNLNLSIGEYLPEFSPGSIGRREYADDQRCSSRAVCKA